MAIQSRRIQAVFEHETEVKTSLQDLVRCGFDLSTAEIRSSIPLEEANLLPGVRTHSRIPLMAISGGLFGGLLAFLIATLTAKAYPIITGGMPIVAPLPVAIITYEGIALGAILATVAGVFWEGHLFSFRYQSGPLDHHVAEGKILLSLQCHDESVAENVKKALAVAVTWQEEQ